MCNQCRRLVYAVDDQTERRAGEAARRRSGQVLIKTRCLAVHLQYRGPQRDGQGSAGLVRFSYLALFLLHRHLRERISCFSPPHPVVPCFFSPGYHLSDTGRSSERERKEMLQSRVYRAGISDTGSGHLIRYPDVKSKNCGAWAGAGLSPPSSALTVKPRGAAGSEIAVDSGRVSPIAGPGKPRAIVATGTERGVGALEGDKRHLVHASPYSVDGRAKLAYTPRFASTALPRISVMYTLILGCRHQRCAARVVRRSYSSGVARFFSAHRFSCGRRLFSLLVQLCPYPCAFPRATLVASQPTEPENAESVRYKEMRGISSSQGSLTRW